MLNQEQKNALALLERERTEENLWNCVVLFQNETFKTMSGLFFTYELKRERTESIRRSFGSTDGRTAKA